MDFGYAGKINAVLFSLVLSTRSVPGSCDSIDRGDFSSFRVMGHDPVSAIGFS